MIKQCNRCKVSKEVTEFPKSSFNKSGYGSPCKECGRKLTKEFTRTSGYREKNRELVNESARKSRKKYKEKYRKNERDRYHSDPVYRLKALLRTNVWRYIINKQGKRTEDILGETFDNVRRHLEIQFVDGMSWNNFGEWHIDHIIPLSSAKTEEEVFKLNHYTNLQPLWAKDNLSKGSKLDWNKE